MTDGLESRDGRVCMAGGTAGCCERQHPRSTQGRPRSRKHSKSGACDANCMGMGHFKTAEPLIQKQPVSKGCETGHLTYVCLHAWLAARQHHGPCTSSDEAAGSTS